LQSIGTENILGKLKAPLLNLREGFGVSFGINYEKISSFSSVFTQAEDFRDEQIFS
jgi:hypothetical protein